MFEPFLKPRVFGLPPGVDFAGEVIAGLNQRLEAEGPEALARVEIVANTRRLQRRLRDVLDEGPARLHPRIRVIGDLALDPMPTLSLPVPPLQRRLELMRLVRGLIMAQPDLAPEAAAIDLADSLARLFDEMEGEGIDPETLRSIEVPEASGHWQRALLFVDVVAAYLKRDDAAPGAEGRLRSLAGHLSSKWHAEPPDHPILMVGSTGSRGATRVLMEAISRLPQGAVILPGFDTDLPETVWNSMGDPSLSEDHPQYRFRSLMDALDIMPNDVGPWTDTPPPCPERNALISLSLRPAPVTDQWLSEAPLLSDLDRACDGMTLVAAESRREEADTIALRLRYAVQEGRTAALISPDRMLTRQVAAALDRWDIVPDDSAGVPLSLSPPGRLFSHVMGGMDPPLRAQTLIEVLKHPLAATGADDRGPHLLMVRELELWMRKRGVPFPTVSDLDAWVEKSPETRGPWADWVAEILGNWSAVSGQVSLEQRLDQHIALLETICAGPSQDGSGGLWDEAAGRAARSLFDDVKMHGSAAGELNQSEFASLLKRLLSAGEVRDRDAGHPQVLIWGTLEARVQSADLVILGSMNDGTWPELPGPDPWLNRQMRREAGLLLPERRVGLSAHDYQLAMAAPEVWITRSIRSDDTQTVPSRWINRLTNLLGGLDDSAPLDAMRHRGAAWVAAARQAAAPRSAVPRAKRPAPCPPASARPGQISVTEVEALTRDPFEIYAKRVLKLRPLHPLQREADALLRGILVHDVMEQFTKHGVDPSDDQASQVLHQITDEVLAAQCPWPTARALWQGRIGRVVDWFLLTEAQRRTQATPTYFEAESETILAQSGTKLIGRADRIDITTEGSAVIYDYKTGTPPSKKQQTVFNPQLLLLAALAERGAFRDLGAMTAKAAYIGLGSDPSEVPAPLDDNPPDKIWAELDALMIEWQSPDRGYTARIANKVDQEDRDYDHLSRLGEWDVTDTAEPVVLT